MSFEPDGSDRQIYARGVRQSVGFAFRPGTSELWFTDNGRDMLGDDMPPDELNRATGPGLHFGFPFCHAGEYPDPEFGDQMACSETEPPAMKLGPHVAAIGMLFYEGRQFPETYRGRVFIAEHGSWNRSNKIGYRVTTVSVDANGRASNYDVFASGWLQDGNENWGRPVDLLELEDGSLLLSDDLAGVIYRISYDGGGSASAGE